MIGASWRGRADHVEIRVLMRSGWSSWMTLEAASGEGPDTSSVEASRGAGRHVVPVPIWVGAVSAYDIRPSPGAPPVDVRIVAINTHSTPADHTAHPTNMLTPAAPTIRTRADWGADESIRRADPAYASVIKAAFVHHTVNGNSYSRGDVPALIRGIYSYHVQSNGWNDIGYNFLIDRFGRVWEGRYGGITKAPIGAHAGGFNTSTTGIALIGDHSTTGVPARARSALASLISWKLDRDHVDPTETTVLTSGGNSTYPAGTNVRVRNVSGHRDVYATECPGNLAYGTINAIRSAAWNRGGPKIAGVRAARTFAPDGTAQSLRIRAHANTDLAWTLTLRQISTGVVLHTLTQRGRSTFDRTWDGTGGAGVPGWDLRWEVTGSADARAARAVSRRFGSVPPIPELQLVSRSAAVATPNSDGRGDSAQVRVRLAARAPVTARVVAVSNPATTIRTLLVRTLPAGEFTLAWSGRSDARTPVAAGRYRIIVTADDPLASRADPELSADVGIDRTLRMGMIPAAFSPDGNGILDSVSATTNVDASVGNASLTLRSRAGAIVRTYASAAALHGAVTTVIDGIDDASIPLPDGLYALTLRASGRPAGTVVVRHWIRIDRHIRRVRIRMFQDGQIRFRAPERIRLNATVYRDGLAREVVRWYAAGEHRSAAFRTARQINLRDTAGNSTTAVIVR